VTPDGVAFASRIAAAVISCSRGRPEAFPEAVRRQFGPFLNDHGFQIVDESTYVVRFESDTLVAIAMLDPRGEVGLEVFRLGREAPQEGGRTGGRSVGLRYLGSSRSRSSV